MNNVIESKVKCNHCGESCEEETISLQGKDFCCNGCMQIYRLLQENNLGQYYDLSHNPGIKTSQKHADQFSYLDDQDVALGLLDFRNDTSSRIHFTLPAIHCSSCIWLLENLGKISDGVLSSRVNFVEKTMYISFDHSILSLKDLVVLLTKIGYEPELNYGKLNEKKEDEPDRTLILKIGVAGFAFGNIMLLSLIEYLGYEMASTKFYIGYINIALSVPVLLYSGNDYIHSAWTNLKAKKLGIHVPVVLGMFALYGRSLYEIFSATGEGYLDSFAGFVMFLLIGKWFSNFTMKSIAFDRSYKSYFPISVAVQTAGSWLTKSIDQVIVNDTIKISSGEIIPCDGSLLSGLGKIDYSFVTGEANLEHVSKGQGVYAGGKQVGGSITLKVTKSVDQSYLTQLWNEKTFKSSNVGFSGKFIDKVSNYFTLCILLIASASFAYWYNINPSIAFKTVSSVLIVACPCALALAMPFILGNATRILAFQEFYAKSIATLEQIFDIDTIVFDKTGTLTEGQSIQAVFVGDVLSGIDKSAIQAVTSQSKHPLSCAITKLYNEFNSSEVIDFEERKGYGISAYFEGRYVRIGSPEFVFDSKEITKDGNVIVEIDGKIVGHYQFKKHLRKNIAETIGLLSLYEISLLSGDNDNDIGRMKAIFPSSSVLLFEKKPKEKLDYIASLQKKGKKVMMIGDGLNDAGALQQSDVGIVISEENNSFSPSCDAIISARRFTNLVGVLSYIKSLKTALYIAFVIAFLYNFIGLSFAVSGQLSPVIAAILMPTSSISIMLFGILSSKFLARSLDKTPEMN